MNILHKKNKLQSICEKLMDGKEGLLYESEKLNLNLSDINVIKNTLLQKSKISSGYEKELFYNVYIKINAHNYINIFKSLDRYFNQKAKKNTIVSAKSSQNLTLEKRTTKEVVISNKQVSEDVRNVLRNYVYIQDSSKNLIIVYLRNKIEYNQNIKNMNFIKNSLDSLNIDFKINFLSEYNTVKEMTKIEKKEFADFLEIY